MTSFWARMKWAQLFVCLGVIALIAEGMSSVSRGSEGKSDLSVFYRTTILLLNGADGSIYSGHDAVSGWYRCIPPAGLMWYAPFAHLAPRAASYGWMLWNFALALAGAWALSGIARMLFPQRKELVWWGSGLFLLLAAPSVEVGQYSLMFCSLALLFLYAALLKRLDLAAVLLALPAAIKIYPALLLLAPLGALPLRKWPRFAGMFALGFAFWMWLAPLAAFGGRVPELNSAFFREIVFSPSGRLSESQSTSASSNHGLDAVMMRFLSNAPEPKGAPPHLGLPVPVVLKATNIVRVLVIAASIALWWPFLFRARQRSSMDWMRSLALWSATLFLILPGAKARYAVYVFPAFLPLLLHAAFLWQTNAKSRGRYIVFIVVLTLLVMSLVPVGPRLWGAGFWGALALWLENGRLLRRTSSEQNDELASKTPLTPAQATRST